MTNTEVLERVEKNALKNGYSVDKTSVDDKNQTRFIHLQLSKAGKKYFAKVNVRSVQLLDLKNEALSLHLTDGERFSVVKPVETIKIDDTRELFIYPFIEHSAISTERSGFSDFSVADSDKNDFFLAAEEMISSIESSSFYSYKDICRQYYDNKETLIEWLSKLDPSSIYPVSALQQLAEILPGLVDLAPAIADLQPQNLFWDPEAKHIYLIDLESMNNMPLGYDRAKFAASVYIVCIQKEVAIDWIKFSIKHIKTSSKSEAIVLLSRLHAMLLWTGLEYYTYFRRINDLDREHVAIEFLKWCLNDYVDLVNS
jgi:hypothetical protein